MNKIEKLYVKDFYDTIADSWTNIRQKFKILEKFKHLKNKKILEVGCGTATQLLEFEGNFLVGIDISKKMIKYALENSKKKNIKLFLLIADARKLPLKQNSFEFVLSIATIHHIYKRKDRIKALLEILRVCKDTCLISVLKRYSSLTIKKLFVDFFRFFSFGNIFLEWNYRGKRLKRFYHTYSLRELKKDLEIVKRFYNISYNIFQDKLNYFILIKKEY
ncbi:MAG: class I SAM-dependent methyltransferase [Candidatus Aenigmatarchaeota archaeon]